MASTVGCLALLLSTSLVHGPAAQAAWTPKGRKNRPPLGAQLDLKRRNTTVTVRGHRLEIHYREMGPTARTGSETKTPLVPVHGVLGSGVDPWASVFPALAKTRRVVAIYLPAHGASPAVDGFSMSMQDLGEVAYEFTKKELNQPVDLLGYSMGGAAASAMAAQHKSWVRRLVLINPVALPFPMDWRGRIADTRIGPLIFKHFYTKPMWRSFVNTFFHEKAVQRRVAPQLIDSLYASINKPGVREAMRLAAVEMGKINSNEINWERKVLRKIGAETLVIAAKEDDVVPKNNAIELRALLAWAKLKLVAGAGHAVVHEKPTEVAHHVAAFLDAPGAKSSAP